MLYYSLVAVMLGATLAGLVAWLATGRLDIAVGVGAVAIIVLAVAGASLGYTHLERVARGSVTDVLAADAAYSRKPRASAHRVVVSFTTLPSRIAHINPTVLSLLTQTVRADEIAINVPWTTRKGDAYEIPDWLASLRHVRIHRFGPDPGPSAKLLPTLTREPDATIVVVDDDSLYGDQMLERLVRAFDAAGRRTVYSNAACNFRERRTFGVAFLAATLHSDLPKECLFGVRGYAVTARMFPRAILDYAAAPPDAVAPYTEPPPAGAASIDDDWIAWWLLAGGSKIRLTPSSLFAPPISVPSLRTASLDALSAESDRQLERALELKDWFARERIFERVRARELGAFCGVRSQPNWTSDELRTSNNATHL